MKQGDESVLEEKFSFKRIALPGCKIAIATSAVSSLLLFIFSAVHVLLLREALVSNAHVAIFETFLIYQFILGSCND